MIQWQDGIPYRQDRLLCSPRDPVGEASRWLARQNILPEDKNIGVVGLGLGLHVLELAKARPDVKIYCLEIDGELIRQFSNLNAQIEFVTAEQLPSVDIVVSFRPCWQGYETEYQSMLHIWAGSHLQAATSSFAEHGFVWMASTLALLPQNQTGVRLAHLPVSQDDESLPEVKIIRTLMELTK